MKKIYLLTKACLFTAAMFMVSACTEDDAVVIPIFPEGETVETVAPGTEYTLTFSANMNWELESSKPWCKFSNGFQSIKGEAGENISQKLTIDEPTTFDAEVAEITLIMGGEEKVIAKYTREGMAPLVTDADGNLYSEENPLVFEYTNNGVELTSTFTVNYDWTLAESDLPEWVKLDESSEYGGNAGESVLVSLYVPETYWLSAQEGTITVRNSEIGCEFSIPVKYTGMPDDIIKVTGLSSVWNWVISQDGTQYWQNSQGNMEEEIQKYELPVTLSVLAKDNEYVVKCLYDDNGWMTTVNPGSDDSFFFYNVEDNYQGTVTIGGFSPLEGAKRKGYVIIMPKSKYNELSHNGTWLDDNVLVGGNGDIKDDLVTYVAMSFEQEGAVEEGVAAIKISVNGNESVEANVGTGTIPDNVKTELDNLYLADNENKDNYIFNYTVSAGDWVTITPFIKNYFGENSAIGKCSIRDFNAPDAEISDFSIEYTGNDYATSSASFQVDKSLIVIIKDDFGMFCKVIILHVN